MVTSLLEHGKIVTTLPRAKEVRRIADRMITLAKDGSLHARRQALSIIKDKDTAKKLFEHWGQKFEGRPGGYCRIIKMGERKGDGAFMSVVEMATESIARPKAGKKMKEGAPTVEAIIPEAKPEIIEESTVAEEIAEGKETVQETPEETASEVTEQAEAGEVAEEIKAEEMVSEEEVQETAEDTSSEEEAKAAEESPQQEESQRPETEKAQTKEES